MKIVNALKYLKNSIPRLLRRRSAQRAVTLARQSVNLSECRSLTIEANEVWLEVRSGYKFFWDYKSENSLITLPLKGTFEPIETEHVCSLIEQGATVFDVGANFGWFSTHLADFVGGNGSVHSFEPIPETFENLRSNVERNGFSGHVRLNNVAVGDDEGEAVLQVPIRMGAGAPFASLQKQTWGKYREIPVKVVSLDNYISKHSITKVDFLKCDVEGAEMLVIKGCKNSLSSKLISRLMLELNDSTLGKFGYSRGSVLSLMQSYGYSAYVLDGHGVRKACNSAKELSSENVFFEIS